MQVRDDKKALGRRDVVPKECIEPVAAGFFAGQTSEGWVVAVDRVEWKEGSIPKCRFAHEINQAAVKRSQAFLFGRKTRAIVMVTVHPPHELGHRPVIEDARACVVAAETFRVR